ncbi:MAG: hypothetical protein SFU21_15160 [Flavihumibacter sp.]|nr:hypothetical protein [Flavihumibacter sp.]
MAKQPEPNWNKAWVAGFDKAEELATHPNFKANYPALNDKELADKAKQIYKEATHKEATESNAVITAAPVADGK